VAKTTPQSLCSPGSLLLQVGKPEIEFPGNEIDYGDQVFGGSVSSGFGLGGLYQTADSFKHPIVDLGFKPLKNAGPMTLEAALGDRCGPEGPAERLDDCSCKMHMKSSKCERV
jgi:hypothetical protein